MLYLSDPDGHGIEIYRDRPRDTWYDAQGNLRGASDPLDLHGILSELDGAEPAWDGLALGSDMGHIHLQVADVAIAEHFYVGVTSVAAGDAVFGYSNMMRQGAYAEYAVVSEAEIALKPITVDFVAAAAVPLAGLTAWQALDAAGLQAGQTILIHGAGGGIGTFAEQFAIAKGARVLGTAAGDKLGLLRELGVTQPIDYTTTRFEDVVRDVDVVLATIGDDVIERSWGVLKPGGILVTPAGQIDAEAAAARGVRGTGMMTQPNSAQLTNIAGLIGAGKVKPVVSTVLPLAEARRAHELGDAGHARGKIVLRIAG